MNLRGFNNAGPDNNDNGPSIGDRIKGFWADIPLFVRFVICLSTFLYFVSLITSTVYILANIPLYTIKHFYLWSVATSVFMNISILNLAFAFFAWIPDGKKLEKENGTIKYMWNFLVNSMIIQIIFLGVVYLLSIKFEDYLKYPSSGLWPLILSEITLLSVANPNVPVMMFLIPCPIQAKYYPWALFGFFTVINGFRQIQFDILAGILYGYAYYFFLKNKIQPSDQFLIKLQNCFPFKHLQRISGTYFY